MGNNVPEKLEDFLEIKYNNKTEYGKLKHSYRIANQYENNSGNMDPMKVVELHDAAVEEKAKFTGRARRVSNIGIMELDGNVYIANSNVNCINDAGYINYKGNKGQVVLKTNNPQFHPFDVGSHPGEVDSECKFFEYASTVVGDGKKHNLRILSERTMCPSCRSVMGEFKERHPNVSVEVVSNREDRAAKSKNRNVAFEIDVKRRYKDENL